MDYKMGDIIRVQGKDSQADVELVVEVLSWTNFDGYFKGLVLERKNCPDSLGPNGFVYCRQDTVEEVLEESIEDES